MTETPTVEAPVTEVPASAEQHDPDAEWTITLDGIDPEREPAQSTLLTLANGHIGVRGAPAACHPFAAPLALAAGVYLGSGDETTIVRCPVFSQLGIHLEPDAPLRRTLDLRTGVLHQELPIDGATAVVRLFVSRVRPGVAGLSARRIPRDAAGQSTLEPPPGRPVEQGRWGGRAWQRIHGSGGVTVAASEHHEDASDGLRVERLAAYLSDPRAAPDVDDALETLVSAERLGFERLLDEHREAWEGRWRDADIRIEGDPELQRNVRFALFHLMASVPDDGEAALGARGLSGPAYRGHVFWDADVFVLPFLAATHPASARAMIRYRANRLAAARRAARARGLDGARFPWESALDGFDVTPPEARTDDGITIPILTGRFEEHIVADVAWAVDRYLAWTGDEEVELGDGRSILAETARYWASRIRIDARGRGHIDDVIGPDEYHERVDDNAFTNVMARWNLRRAAACGGLPEHEAVRWRWLADALADGFDPSTGIYEQFAGFFDLEPLRISELSPVPVAADVLLGRERTRGSQVVKQPDVLMLHLLVPDEVEPASLGPNLDFYGPRTAHGSSLSLPIHAALLARAGRVDEAAELLRVAARIDIDDVYGATAEGLHLAAMGGLWQALAVGFVGVGPTGSALALDPVLPACWDAIDLRLRFRESRVRIRVEPETVAVHADPAVAIRVGKGGRTFVAVPEGTVVTHRSR